MAVTSEELLAKSQEVVDHWEASGQGYRQLTYGIAELVAKELFDASLATAATIAQLEKRVSELERLWR